MSPGSSLLLNALGNEGPLTREQLLDWVSPGIAGGKRGWAAPAWHPVERWTDEEWDQARQEDADGSFVFGPDAPLTAAEKAEKNAQELEAYRQELARSDAYSAALGIAPVRTMANALEYLITCGVVSERRQGSKTLYDLNPDAALPAEVLPLSEVERAAEDHERSRKADEPVAESLIALFEPEGPEQVDRKQTSLERLAHELGSDIESVRAGVLELLSDGDFVATIDVEQAEPHAVFELIVDWESFQTQRISLTASRAENPAED